MVVNVAIENKDDHANNFSFIYKGGNRTLILVYDLLKSKGFGGEHATSVLNEENPKREDMLKLAEELNYPKKEMIKIIEKVYDIT